MDDPKDIYEVLLILQRERPVLTKDKKGQVGNQKTKYADLEQVNEVVLARLNDMETIWVCRPHIEAGVFGLHYQLRHVPSGTEEAGIWPLKLSENPQQMGSATSYGRRYALLAVTGIVAAEEDDDGASAQAGVGAQRAQRREAPRPAAPAESRAQRAPSPAGPPLPGEANPERARRAMMAEFTRTGFNAPEKRAEMLGRVGRVIGREIGSRNELTPDEVLKVTTALKRLPDARPATESLPHEWTYDDLFAAVGLGDDKPAQLRYAREVIGRSVGSLDDLTESEHRQLTQKLANWMAQETPPTDSHVANGQVSP